MLLFPDIHLPRVCVIFALFVSSRLVSSRVRVHTAEITFQFVDKKASIFFWGQMDSITPTETRLSVRLPVKGVHEILVGYRSNQ